MAQWGTMMTFLGIDIGTSSVKLTVIDESCTILATENRRYSLLEPHVGWREIDPESWWVALCVAARTLFARVSPSSLAGVCVTGQMHTTVFADEYGRPVCNSISWNDQRALDDVRPARDALRIALEPQIAKTVSTGSPAISIAWIHKNAPEALEKTASLLGVSDWIACKLGGHAGVDWCWASTSSLFSLATLNWSEAACDYFGVPRRALPTIEDADQIIGSVSVEASLETGIPAGTPIIRGTGDNPAAALATGGAVSGTPTISLGTSGVLMYAHYGVELPEFGKPVLFREGGELRTLVQLTVKSCGSSLDWWVSKVLGHDSFDVGDECVERIDHDMRDLIFFPHLCGEKIIHADPGLRGAFLGLDLDTTRAELTRAVMEGISFGLRSLKDVVMDSDDWSTIRVIGGGSKSDLWMAILSNVLGVNIARIKTCGASQGAAMLALSAVRGERMTTLADQSIDLIDQTQPHAQIQARYDLKYRRYLRIFDALKSIYQE